MKGAIKLLQIGEIEQKYRRYAELSEKIFRNFLSAEEATELENLSGELDEIEHPFYEATVDKLENLLREAQQQ